MRNAADQLPNIPPPLLDGLLDAVVQHSGVTREEILGLTRQSRVVNQRHVVALVLRRTTQATLMEIGGALNKDHSWVVRALEKIEERMEADEKLCKVLGECYEVVYPIAEAHGCLPDLLRSSA